MAGKTWTVNLEGINHTIELEHGTWSGKRIIKLDGQIIEESKKLVDSGTDHFFMIGEHTCAIHIRSGGIKFKYDLSLDGVSAETGKATKMLDGTPATLYTSETADTFERIKLEKQLKSGANWFFWIAGLSLINTIVFLFDGSIYFVVGLGMTQIVDGIFYILGTEINPDLGLFFQIMGLVINLALLGALVFFGFKARNQKKWAFITGMILYGLDVLILIWANDLFSILFHALALFGLFQGYRAAGKLNDMDQVAPVGFQEF